MTGVRFEKNLAFESELQAEPEFRAAMNGITVAVAEEVNAHAPRHTDAYARSIRAGTPSGHTGYFVWTADPAGHLIEWGSENNPAYAPLRLGVRSAGLRLDEILK